MQPKIWDRDAVLFALENSDRFLARALWNLYQRQEADERQERTTRHSNGRGFNARDAGFLSDVAAKLPRYDFRMTPAQARAVRKSLRKYAGQLLDVIEESGHQVVRERGPYADPDIQLALNGKE